jgi:hypothetical protein
MAFRTKKISQMDPKGANLASTDLLEISELVSGSYVTKSITGAEIIASVPASVTAWGTITGTLSAQTDLNTALSGKVPTTRTISTTAPLSGGGDLSANRTLSIATADTTTTGALSSTDWNTFNNKVPTSRTLTINGTTQDLSADRTFTISTGITIGTTAITSGTVGRVLFEGTGNVVQESANLFWDNTNGRLGIGTSSPSAPLNIVGGTETFAGFQRSLWLKTSTNAKSSVELILENTFTTTGRMYEIASYSDGTLNINDRTSGGSRLKIDSNYFQFHSSATSNANLLGTIGSINALWFNQTSSTASTSNYTLCNSSGLTLLNAPTGGSIYFRVGNSDKALLTNGGNLLINTTTDAGYKLDVNGTARVSGGITLPFSAGVTINSSTNDLVFNVPFYYRIMATGSDTGTVISSMWNGAQMINGLNRKTVITNTTGNGTSSGTITPSAILDVQSTTLGFLPPRMTTTQKNAIASPATGLMVYDTTLNLMALYNGTTWTTL